MNSNAESIGLIRHEDMIQPFMLHNSIMRGRLVRLDQALNAILNRHDYHEIVSKQLGELLAIAAMLSANLPEEGVLHLQVKGDGAVSFMVVDVRPDGSIRGYASMAEDGLAHIGTLEAQHASLPDIFGSGYLAITLTNPHSEPYQGSVPLEGESLSEACAHYFSQSQQLDVAFHIHISKRIRDTKEARWVAGGIMLERMPELSANAQQQASSTSNEQAEEQDDANNWDYHKLLIETATEEELSDPHLAPSALLYRLFHEIGVWVYDTKPILDQCHCSPNRFEEVLCSMGTDALTEMAEDGSISMSCQFCSREQTFELDALLEKAASVS